MQGDGSFQLLNTIFLLLPPLYAVSHILFAHSSPWSWWLQCLPKHWTGYKAWCGHIWSYILETGYKKF